MYAADAVVLAIRIPVSDATISFINWQHGRRAICPDDSDVRFFHVPLYPYGVRYTSRIFYN